MAGTTQSNAAGRARLIDNTVLFNRYLDSLAKRTSQRLPDGIPTFPANPDGGFLDIQTALSNLAFLVKANTWKNAIVATGASTVAQVIWAGPGGKLLNITVQTPGTVAISIYDNASAASGNVLFTVPANPAANAFYQVQAGAMNGITAGRVLNSSAILISYSEV